MKTEISHDMFGKITYEENFWTGKKNLRINKTPAVNKGKGKYICYIGDEKIDILLKGNFITGIQMIVGSEKFQLTDKSKWYEIASSVLIFIFILVWGNSVALCEIFPLVGGAIGGFISALFAMLNLLFMKKTRNLLYKLLIFIAAFGLTILCCYLIALGLIALVG